MNLNKKNSLLSAILIFPIAFRNAFETTMGDFGGILSLLPLVLGSLFYAVTLLSRMRVPRANLFPIGFSAYCFLAVLFFSLLTIVDNPMTPLFGFFQLILPILLALFIARLQFSEQDRNRIIGFIIFIGFINALGGIVQYYLSSGLFGLISNRVYDGIIEQGPNVGKRAISFFASPQSLAILLAFCIPLAFNFKLSTLKKCIILLVLFSCGILTGSKAFFIYLLTYMLFSLELKKSILLLVVLVLLFCVGSTGVEVVDRILDLKYKIVKLSEYPNFIIWHDFLTYPSSYLQILFGKGFGVISTSSQLIYNYKVLDGSAESFLVHLYFELGVIGVLLFSFMYFVPALKLANKKSTKYIGVALLAMISNMAFTPAFYGFGVSTIVYLVLFVTVSRSSDTLKNSSTIGLDGK